MMRFLRRFFPNFFAPRLQSDYSVYYQGQLIARLLNPSQADQFWFSFILKPLVADETLLAVLYDDKNWGTSLVIKETRSQEVVKFLIQMDAQEQGDQVVFRNVLAERPERVPLRGPYAV